VKDNAMHRNGRCTEARHRRRSGEKASLPPNADSPRMKGADSGSAEGVPRISLCTSAAL